MTGRQKFFLALAGAHLLLVAYHAVLLPLPAAGDPIGDSLRWYGAMSGANNSYGFFKQVGCSLRVDFLLSDGKDRTWKDSLHRDENNEVKLRFNAGINLMDNLGDIMLNHWAAAMFGRHPQAQVILVTVHMYNPGTMADYRDGNRPEWQQIDNKWFVRGENGPQPMEGK